MSKFTKIINKILSNSNQLDIKQRINKSSFAPYHGIQVSNNEEVQKFIIELKNFYKNKGYKEILSKESEGVIFMDEIFDEKKVYWVNNSYEMNQILAREIEKGKIDHKDEKLKFYVLMTNRLGIKQMYCFNKKKYDIECTKDMFFYRFYNCLQDYNEKIFEASRILANINEDWNKDYESK